jgi:hypothetical protein
MARDDTALQAAMCPGTSLKPMNITVDPQCGTPHVAADRNLAVESMSSIYGAGIASGLRTFVPDAEAVLSDSRFR